jgi:hypothetical protein
MKQIKAIPMSMLSDTSLESLKCRTALTENEELDEAIGDMYRTSYFNPVAMTARILDMKVYNTKPDHRPKALMKSPKNEAILKAMEKRVNTYLHKQKKEELYMNKTLGNWQTKSYSNLKLR